MYESLVMPLFGIANFAYIDVLLTDNEKRMNPLFMKLFST